MPSCKWTRTVFTEAKLCKVTDVSDRKDKFGTSMLNELPARKLRSFNTSYSIVRLHISWLCSYQKKFGYEMSLTTKRTKLICSVYGRISVTFLSRGKIHAYTTWECELHKPTYKQNKNPSRSTVISRGRRLKLLSVMSLYTKRSSKILGEIFMVKSVFKWCSHKTYTVVYQVDRRRKNLN